MKVKIYAFTRAGAALCLKLNKLFEAQWEIGNFVPERYASMDFLTGFTNLAPEQMEHDFSSSDVLIFIGSAGIAVRKTASFITSKDRDPAVIVIDEKGQYVIPILSGHIGGGNQLAVQIAQQLGATAVITTATDINQVFSVDVWAKEQGYYIHNIGMIKEVSAALLEGRTVGLHTGLEIQGALPRGIQRRNDLETGIYIGYVPAQPYDKTLWLAPKNIIVGLGCRRNTSAEELHHYFLRALDQYVLKPEMVQAIASIDIKKEERAVLMLAERYHYDLYFYTAEELSGVEGDFTSSAFVADITGVDNVCERAAVLGSGNGRLIAPKTVGAGMTFAAAAGRWTVNFQAGE